MRAISIPKKNRLVAFGVMLMSIVAVSMWLGMSHLQERSIKDYERQRAEWRQRFFDDARDGRTFATIMDPEIIPMLSNDADCVRNISLLQFSMVKIEPSQVAGIERLTNVRHIHFYDTQGVDAVLETAKLLPIESLAFDLSRPSETALKGLADFPNLRRIHFGETVYPRDFAILEGLNPDLEIDAIHRAELDPVR